MSSDATIAGRPPLQRMLDAAAARPVVLARSNERMATIRKAMKESSEGVRCPT